MHNQGLENDVDQPLQDDDERLRRRQRFGTLPARVQPSETVDTRTAPGRPASAMSTAQVDALLAGG